MSEERFWSKVDIGEPEDCWAWLKGKDLQGYSQFKLNGKTIGGHRYSWILKNGAIPAGLVVRHKCRGQCVNPDHLELGTKKQNNGDMIRDGTSLKGIKHHNCKLTEEKVRQIRTSSKTQGELSKDYNISGVQISNIITGKSWKWLV